MAWWNAVPEPAPIPEGKKAPAPKRELSRREKLASGGRELQMPDPGPGEHLLAYLWEIGPTVPAGSGAGPIPFQEMQAWSEISGKHLQPWEYSVLRSLSEAYLAESQRATNRDARAPMVEEKPETEMEKRRRLKQAERALDKFLGD